MHDVSDWQHRHDYRPGSHRQSERRTYWVGMDPLMGIVGALVISRWAWGLLRDSGSVLLDAEDDDRVGGRIHILIESDKDNHIADLHIWRVGPRSRACIVSLVTNTPRPVEYYRQLLSAVPDSEHLTVEINHCMPDLSPGVAEGS